MFKSRSPFFHGLIATMLLAAVASATPASAADRYRVNARLFGPTGMKGQARYEEQPKNGSLQRRFKVEVERGTPGATHQIFVNGDNVGSVLVGPLGIGKFELRTPQHIDSPEDGEPMPDDFPVLGTGDSVEVGPLSGTMFITVSSGSNPPPPLVQSIRLRGDFDGAGAASGKVEYRERFKSSGGLERRFKVEIEDASPNTNFQVRVNGQLVATVTTNGAGFVEFQCRTAAFIDSPDDGIPMPNSFPSLVDGDVVTVGSMSTTLHND